MSSEEKHKRPRTRRRAIWLPKLTCDHNEEDKQQALTLLHFVSQLDVWNMLLLVVFIRGTLEVECAFEHVNNCPRCSTPSALQLSVWGFVAHAI